MDYGLEIDNQGWGYDSSLDYYDAPASNPRSKSARALKKAGRYRREGYDASSALTQAWSDVRGKSASNPLDAVLNPITGAQGGC